MNSPCFVSQPALSGDPQYSTPSYSGEDEAADPPSLPVTRPRAARHRLAIDAGRERERAGGRERDDGGMDSCQPPVDYGDLVSSDRLKEFFLGGG